jgi:hypothetical protein
MLGITPPDAIAIGTVIAAALVGLFGKKSADVLLKSKPLDPSTSGVAAGFVDKDLMLRLVMSNESIASTLKEIVGIQTDEHERAVNDRLERIEAAVVKKNDDDMRSQRAVDRGGERMERTVDRVTGRKREDR